MWVVSKIKLAKVNGKVLTPCIGKRTGELEGKVIESTGIKLRNRGVDGILKSSSSNEEIKAVHRR